MAVIAVIIGLLLFRYGADRCVVGAVGTDGNPGVSRPIIGLTVVGFATSAQEIVAADAALVGGVNVAIGNAAGSTISNLGLALGLPPS